MDFGSMFFDGWQPIVRTIIIGIAAYFSLIVLLRTSGKRTLSKMNVFDFIVTVALGSTLATILLSKEVALLQGIVGFCVLIFSQYAITWLSVRSDRFERLVKSEPTLVVHQGQILHTALRTQRVTPDEVDAAARESGLASAAEARSIVLETDGSFSVTKRD